MSAVFDSLIEVANRTGRPVSEVVRHHFLEAVLRRLGGTQEPEFVLRGSMLTRLWGRPFPRIANDLDFLATFPHSVPDTTERFFPALTTEHPDEVRFNRARCSAKNIWEGSEFPGVRLTLSADVFGDRHTTTVDVGFGDPLVPDAEVVDYPLMAGDAVRLWAVHPATLIAWKLHGLAEWGQTRWRPKDLLDLWLLLGSLGTARLPLAPKVLGEAIRVAFASRHYNPADARLTLEDPIWQTFSARANWDRFREEQLDVPVPESLTDVHAAVVTWLAPALALLPT